MAYIPTTAKAQIELSSIQVAGRTVTLGLLEVNAQLGQRVLAARRSTIVARPSAPMTYYANPDGTVCTSRAEAQAFHGERFYTPA